MTPTLFGVPLDLYGMACLLLAFAWLIAWPRARAPERGPRRVILRWGHSLVWLMLALAAFIGGTGVLGGLATAGPLAFAALLLCILFLGTLLTSPPPRRQAEDPRRR